jgi:hypothetical protein
MMFNRILSNLFWTGEDSVPTICCNLKKTLSQLKILETVVLSNTFEWYVAFIFFGT